MRRYHHHQRRRRARGGRAIVVLLLGILAAGFFRAQILRSSSYALRSESNRLRALSVPAPRGTVFDRDGRVVADNVPGYGVWLLPAARDSLPATLRALAPHLGLGEERIEEILEDARRSPYQPVLVDPDVAFDEVSAVEERRARFPGLFIEMRPKRRYPVGPAVAHAVGHVGEVSDPELRSPVFAGVESGQLVGKTGIERQYEERLRGEAGVRYVEVDALGRIVGDFGARPEIPARPGRDVRLSLDLELQEWIHRIFPDTMRGSVVALDVEDGSVLALYSSPAFDPNDFVGGVTTERWAELNTDPARPLLNRAVQGLYPPGSTWKLASAAIALEEGVVTPEDTMPIRCEGGLQYGNRYFRCWDPEGHGSLKLAAAIKHSCDVYFYQLGLKVGLDRLLRDATRMGFSEPTGIDLPVERAGIFPAARSFWEERFGYRATPSEVLSLAIGQGPNSQTPLKIAQLYAALARDGAAPAPRLVPGGATTPEWRIDISGESLAALREGLRGVVEPGGTAHLSSLEHWALAGKTGTAQNSRDPERDHAWFAGFAGPRGEDPEIAVAAIVEFGEHGSTAAAPLVAKTADYWLRRKHGIPVDTIQTLGEHLRAGVPAPWARWEVEETSDDGPAADAPPAGGPR